MVDLGRPDTFEDAEGVIDLVEIPNFFQPGPLSGVQYEFYITSGNLLWRPRFVSIFGDVGGTVGSVAIAFQGLTSGASGTPWPSGGPLIAAAAANVLTNESYGYSWSTEVGTSYSNVSLTFDRIAVSALPLVYLPHDTTFSIAFRSVGGYDGDFNVDGGMLQLERLKPAGAGGGAGGGPLYLLAGGG